MANESEVRALRRVAEAAGEWVGSLDALVAQYDADFQGDTGFHRGMRFAAQELREYVGDMRAALKELETSEAPEKASPATTRADTRGTPEEPAPGLRREPGASESRLEPPASETGLQGPPPASAQEGGIPWWQDVGRRGSRARCPRHPEDPSEFFEGIARCSGCGEALDLCGDSLGSKRCVREKGHDGMHLSPSATGWGRATPNPEERCATMHNSREFVEWVRLFLRDTPLTNKQTCDLIDAVADVLRRPAKPPPETRELCSAINPVVGDCRLWAGHEGPHVGVLGGWPDPPVILGGASSATGAGTPAIDRIVARIDTPGLPTTEPTRSAALKWRVLSAFEGEYIEIAPLVELVREWKERSARNQDVESRAGFHWGDAVGACAHDLERLITQHTKERG